MMACKARLPHAGGQSEGPVSLGQGAPALFLTWDGQQEVRQAGREVAGRVSGNASGPAQPQHNHKHEHSNIEALCRHRDTKKRGQ